jgi:hypothetical protein
VSVQPRYGFVKCEHPECSLEGTCRAPKTRALDSYYLFCPKHAAEYNKSWNYCNGMSAEEIERETKADETWRAPTWKFGVGLKGLRGLMDDPLGVYAILTGKAPPPGAHAHANPPAPKLPADKLRAVRTLGVEYPFTKKSLSDAYKKLAKTCHPDVNADPAAEERFKEVAAAYSLLREK